MQVGRRCSVCSHHERETIDVALAANNSSFRNISKRYAVSPAALLRHKGAHLQPRLVRAAERREALSAEQIAAKLERLVVRMESLLDKSEAKGDAIASTRAAKELRESLIAVGKLLGLWTDRPQTVIDQRRQTLVFDGLGFTLDELRALARGLGAPPEKSE